MWPSPYFTDFLRVQAWRYPQLLRRRGELFAAGIALVRGIVQRREYERLEALFDERISCGREPAIAQLFELAEPYLHPEVDVPVTTQVAKVVDFVRKGAAGVVHVLPIHCMLSTAAAGAFPRIRADHGGAPILTLIYDGLQATNQTTRLQAFMSQLTGRPAACPRRAVASLPACPSVGATP